MPARVINRIWIEAGERKLFTITSFDVFDNARKPYPREFGYFAVLIPPNHAINIP